MSDDKNDAVAHGANLTAHLTPRNITLGMPEIGRPALTVHNPLIAEKPDHPFFTLIGRTAAHMAQFEHVLDGTVSLLIKHHAERLPAAAISALTGQFLGAQSRLDAIKALVQLYKLPDFLIKQCNQLERNVAGPQKKRNRIVHDAWFVSNSDDVSRYRNMSKDEKDTDGSRLHGVWVVKHEEMESVITDINALFQEALQLRHNIVVALDTLPETPHA